MTANAGILGPDMLVPFEDIPSTDFAFSMDVNFWGVLRSFKYAIPAIKRAGGGAMTLSSTGVRPCRRHRRRRC